MKQRESGPAALRSGVHAQGLSRVYGTGPTAVRALRGVELDIKEGELVVLLGPSGSGKTTLLNLIGALDHPTSGELTVGGREIGELDESARTEYRLHTVGFVFQFFNLVPSLTALENVALIAELTGPAPEERATAALVRLGLGDRLSNFPGQLSGGEQQRVAIARGLVKEPRVLLCDEPTGALDVDTGKTVLAALRAATADSDRTVLLVTHNVAIARIADRVIRLRDGEVVDDAVNSEPADPGHLDW